MATRESVVKDAAKRSVLRSQSITAKGAINEAVEVAKSYTSKRYDYFLSHAHKDANIVLGVKTLIEEKGFSVYVDWIDDPNSGDQKISKENAEIIRSAMSRCDQMVYLHTKNASLSKWCPWELGYFDNKGNELIKIVYVSLSSFDEPGQEYLELYEIWDLH